MTTSSEKYTDNNSKAIIESEVNGDVVPIEQFRQNIQERLAYCAEHAPSKELTISKKVTELVHAYFGQKLYAAMMEDFTEYAKDNSEAIDELLSLKMGLNSTNLPDNCIAVRNPHEMTILMNEGRKIAHGANQVDSIEN